MGVSRSKRVGDLLNEAILHVDISMEGLVIVHDPPAFDQKPVALLSECQNGVQGLEGVDITLQFNTMQQPPAVIQREHKESAVVLKWARWSTLKKKTF